MSRFQTFKEWLRNVGHFIVPLLPVLLGIGAVAVVVVGFLALVGAAISIGLPLAAAVLVGIVIFFAIAWVPFAVVILLFGIFSYGRSIMTHRTRNALIVTCIAIFIGDLFSVELTESPLFQILNLPESAYAGYAVILVLISAILYTRFVYLDGLKSLVAPAVAGNTSRPVLTLLAFPSFAIMAILMDLLVPLAFTAIVLDRHGCQGLELFSRFALGIEAEYKLGKRWDDAVKTVSNTPAWQNSLDWLTGAAQSAYQSFPKLADLVDQVKGIDLALPNLAFCNEQSR